MLVPTPASWYPHLGWELPLNQPQIDRRRSPSLSENRVARSRIRFRSSGSISSPSSR